MRLPLCILLCAGLLASGACRSKEAPAPAPSVIAEAPAPASLVAELSVGNPKETWQRLRLLGGTLAQALPSSLAVLFATSLGLPPAAAGNVDEAVPVVGVLLAREGATEPDLVVGVHVLSGAELVASLTLGDGAKYRKVELAPRLVRLVSAPGAAEPRGALGVSGNYLLLASGVDALREAGRFVAESVSKRARVEPGFTLRANEKVLKSSLVARLRTTWQARRAGLAARDRAERDAKGRPPDFADPEVLLSGVDNTVESWLGVLESSRDLSLELTPEADRLQAELLLSPGAEGAAALMARELAVGSLGPLLELPASARLGLLLRGDAQPSAGGFGASVAKLFGERLNERDAARLVTAFDNFSRARRGATVLGFVPSPAPGLVLRCELSENGSFTDALTEVLALVQLPAVRSWLGELVGTPTLEVSQAASGERRAKLRFRRAPADPSPLPSTLFLSFRADGGVGQVLLSPDEKLSLTQLDAVPKLATVTWLAKGQAQLGEEAALGLFADARLALPGGPDEAPVLLSFGKKAERISLGLSLSAAALPAVARLFALEKSP
ncbi:MAG: uncharacterized protein K0R38_3141 [Polyangiaceae bacterium]|nr:uncharacterized protein [Polyangiaceae bacterium]